MDDSIRLYVLARELNIEAQDLVSLCRTLGIEVKNQLSSVTLPQRVQLEEALRRGSLEVQRPVPASDRAFAPAQPEKNETAVIVRPQPQYAPANNPGLERLLDLGKKGGFERLEMIASVAQIDPECAMFKIRKLAERLCLLLVKPKPLEDLSTAIKEFEKGKLLRKKAISYLQQVRTLANVAVHVSEDLFDDNFSMHDVNTAAAALASVMEEALLRKMIAGKCSSS
jgi:hypothetical protein